MNLNYIEQNNLKTVGNNFIAMVNNFIKIEIWKDFRAKIVENVRENSIWVTINFIKEKPISSQNRTVDLNDKKHSKNTKKDT